MLATVDVVLLFGEQPIHLPVLAGAYVSRCGSTTLLQPSREALGQRRRRTGNGQGGHTEYLTRDELFEPVKGPLIERNMSKLSNRRIIRRTEAGQYQPDRKTSKDEPKQDENIK